MHCPLSLSHCVNSACCSTCSVRARAADAVLPHACYAPGFRFLPATQPPRDFLPKLRYCCEQPMLPPHFLAAMLEPCLHHYLITYLITGGLKPYVHLPPRLFAVPQNSTMTLDLCDRQGKYSNGFCHWPQPAWRKPDGTFVSSKVCRVGTPSASGGGRPRGVMCHVWEMQHQSFSIPSGSASRHMQQSSSPAAVTCNDLYLRTQMDPSSLFLLNPLGPLPDLLPSLPSFLAPPPDQLHQPGHA